jgi:hypothetical protein
MRMPKQLQVVKTKVIHQTPKNYSLATIHIRLTKSNLNKLKYIYMPENNILVKLVLILNFFHFLQKYELACRLNLE